jgi:hypothetical protein
VEEGGVNEAKALSIALEKATGKRFCATCAAHKAICEDKPGAMVRISTNALQWRCQKCVDKRAQLGIVPIKRSEGVKRSVKR